MKPNQPMRTRAGPPAERKGARPRSSNVLAAVARAAAALEEALGVVERHLGESTRALEHALRAARDAGTRTTLLKAQLRTFGQSLGVEAPGPATSPEGLDAERPASH